MNSTHELIQRIEKTGVQFFQDFTHLNHEKPTGLTVDHTGNLSLSSIASTGYFLSSLVIGVARGYLSRELAISQAKITLNTFIQHVPHFHGFYAHFLTTESGSRHQKSEFSTIDTALAINGMITVDSYFKDIEISRLTQIILDRLDWSVLIHQRGEKHHFYMAYNPDRDGDYVNGKPGFIHHWSMFAEQLMMYIMFAAVTDNQSLAKKLYRDFERKQVTYQNHSYFYTPGNSLFVYQYPQCWLDLKHYEDEDGINWFENTRAAIYGHFALSRNTVKDYPTFGEHYFGFTASYGRKGYQVSGAIPNAMNRIEHDGSVATNAMIGSLYHAPELAIPALTSLMNEGRFWDDRYGFINAFNDEPPAWISSRWLGIDKGLELLMANAYTHRDVMKAYMAHPFIQRGIKQLGWKQK